MLHLALPDQVIDVDFSDGLDINANPVWVTGRLRLAPGKSHLAPFGYVLEAETVTPANLPDAPKGG